MSTVTSSGTVGVVDSSASIVTSSSTVANCATLAAILPAQTASLAAALLPTTMLTNGCPVVSEITSLFDKTLDVAIGAKADPSKAAPTTTAESFFIFSFFINCFTPCVFFSMLWRCHEHDYLVIKRVFLYKAFV